MCEDCGCAETAHTRTTETVSVQRALLEQNDRIAAHNRAHLREHGIASLNLMSSPGSGKTSLLEATIRRLQERVRIGVIEGDLETENDARRIRRLGVPVVQITTGSACHLDAAMVHDALHELPLDQIDLLFIENVGNLVCPASFDLGQDCNVALLSVAEGDDKPAKYPVMFRAAQLVLLTKIDLLAAVGDFDVRAARESVRALANPAPVLEVSARTEQGLDSWLDWLGERWSARSAVRAAARG
jgi:hydrogenase nickel incorporation protein HypB